jgi:hypothetical protein
MNDEQVSIWMEKLLYIPVQILSEIVDQIIDTSKYMPTPGEIKSAFGEYRRNNPGKFIDPDHPIQECDTCNGKGIILAWKESPAAVYEYGFACGHCENWKRVYPTKPSGYPMFIIPPTPKTAMQIIEMGFTLDDPLRVEPIMRGKYHSVTDMVENIGR